MRNPCAWVPSRSAASTRPSCVRSNFGFRPAPLIAATSPRRNCRYLRLTLWRVTPNARATSACVLPALNHRAAHRRRGPSARKSRRVSTWMCVLIAQHTISVRVGCHSILRDSVIHRGYNGLQVVGCSQAAETLLWPPAIQSGQSHLALSGVCSHRWLLSLSRPWSIPRREPFIKIQRTSIVLLARIIHDGSSRNRAVALQDRHVVPRGSEAPRLRGVFEQYVEGASGELARRRLVAAANPRLQQKRS